VWVLPYFQILEKKNICFRHLEPKWRTSKGHLTIIKMSTRFSIYTLNSGQFSPTGDKPSPWEKPCTTPKFGVFRAILEGFTGFVRKPVIHATARHSCKLTRRGVSRIKKNASPRRFTRVNAVCRGLTGFRHRVRHGNLYF
jgi:hypothetical protein